MNLILKWLDKIYKEGFEEYSLNKKLDQWVQEKLCQPFSIGRNQTCRLPLPVAILSRSKIIVFSLHSDSHQSTHSTTSTAAVSKSATTSSELSSKPQALSKSRMSHWIRQYSSLKNGSIGPIIQTLLYDGLPRSICHHSKLIWKSTIPSTENTNFFWNHASGIISDALSHIFIRFSVASKIHPVHCFLITFHSGTPGVLLHVYQKRRISDESRGFLSEIFTRDYTSPSPLTLNCRCTFQKLLNVKIKSKSKLFLFIDVFNYSFLFFYFYENAMILNESKIIFKID
jgi:hypothetical protein